MLKRKETEYSETVTDFIRYYSTSVFLSKNRKEYYVTSSLVELENGDIVEASDTEGCNVISGFPAEVVDKKSAKLLEIKTVTTKDLDFSKKFHSFYVDTRGNRLFSVSHINPHTYKKGMDYRNDYSYTVLNSSKHTIRSEIKIRSLINSYSLESKDINKDINKICNGKISFFIIKGKYVAATNPQYSVPLIYFKDTLVGYIDPVKKLKIFSSGPIAERLNRTYGVR